MNVDFNVLSKFTGLYALLRYRYFEMKNRIGVACFALFGRGADMGSKFLVSEFTVLVGGRRLKGHRASVAAHTFEACEYEAITPNGTFRYAFAGDYRVLRFTEAVERMIGDHIMCFAVKTEYQIIPSAESEIVGAFRLRRIGGDIYRLSHVLPGLHVGGGVMGEATFAF